MGTLSQSCVSADAGQFVDVLHELRVFKLGLFCLLQMPLVGVGGVGKASDLITSLETK